MKSVKNAIGHLNQLIWACVMITLKDKFGFGADRLSRLYRTAHDVYMTNIDRGTLKLSDVLSALEKDGITIHAER